MINRRWTTTGVALAAALTLALAACSEDKPTQEVRSGSPAVTTVPSRPSSSAPPTAGAPGSVDPSPPVTGSPGAGEPAGDAGRTLPPATTTPGEKGPAHRWEGYTVGADGVTLTFTYYAGVEPCSVFDSVVAEEGPDTVRVSIYERSGPGETVCIMMAQLKSATVTLAAPLGGRTVVDGAT